MRLGLHVFSVISIVFTLLLPFGKVCAAHQTPPNITIAVLPCSDVVKTFERTNPLIRLIENKTGFNVQALFPESEKELIRLFRKGNADFALNSPHAFATLNDVINPRSLLKALGPDGSAEETGFLVVRKDSGLESIHDLRGKSVIMGMECSAGRWRCARKMFEQHGIDIERDLASYKDGGCCEDISFNVFFRAADAGLVCQHYFEEQKRLGNKHIEALRVIARSPPAPTPFFAAHTKTPESVIDKVRESLMAINSDDPSYNSLVRVTEISGFVSATPEEYMKLSAEPQ
jgi:ABC-type phosphate/phosphonate transport system substrate-binding protein